MTQWKRYYWLFINGQAQFSSFDEEKYHEPLVHPAMTLTADRREILILGGGDGVALREVLKHPDVVSVTLVDLDKEMTDLARNHPVLVEINQGSMNSEQVEVVNMDARAFLRENHDLYGVIIIDLPDPDSVDLMHLYSLSFYRLVRRHLIRSGALVTQATSPYFSRKAFLCIMKTIREAGFSALPYHNQIPTMGEWGWILGMRKEELDEKTLKRYALTRDFTDLKTRFLNRDALISMVHFGKGIVDEEVVEKISANTEINPVLHRYYLSGKWAMY
jgi:spermidine synthase